MVIDMYWTFYFAVSKLAWKGDGERFKKSSYNMYRVDDKYGVHINE